MYSQYELEYLRDNVRRSEWVGRENHVYLHYTDWGTFCAYLQILNLRPLLEEEKLVFLMEDEISQYPLDFKARFGIDYSQCPVRPVGVREIQRLIWHTQLSSHNGGDFFNEIFDNHPNLIVVDSIMFYTIQEHLDKLREWLSNDGSKAVDTGIILGDGNEEKGNLLLNQLRQMHNRTEKDLFVVLYLLMADLRSLDQVSRIVPAIFFQPHFHDYHPSVEVNQRGFAVADSEEYQMLHNFAPLKGFKYIKTFTPMRRPTSSTGACVRFMQRQVDEWEPEQELRTMNFAPLKGFKYIKTFTPMRRPTSSTGACVRFMQRQVDEWEPEQELRTMPDELAMRALSRNYMVDWQDRLFQDSVLVRFEDGKLNSKATFTALAAFLDLPYTKSMTYCSRNGERDPESLKGNDRGFDPAAIYRTYEEYLGREERVYLEYLMRDVYRRYGYDFQCYDGSPMETAS